MFRSALVLAVPPLAAQGGQPALGAHSSIAFTRYEW